MRSVACPGRSRQPRRISAGCSRAKRLRSATIHPPNGWRRPRGCANRALRRCARVLRLLSKGTPSIAEPEGMVDGSKGHHAPSSRCSRVGSVSPCSNRACAPSHGDILVRLRPGGDCLGRSDARPTIAERTSPTWAFVGWNENACTFANLLIEVVLPLGAHIASGQATAEHECELGITASQKHGILAY